MVIVKAPEYKGVMIIPQKITGVSKTTFEKITLATDFEEYLNNHTFRLITAYAFKDLGKPRTSLMSNAAKKAPELVDLEVSDFTDEKLDPKDFRFTDKKFDVEMNRLFKKIDDEPVSILIRRLMKLDYLPNNKNMTQFLNNESLSELTMQDLSNERKISEAIGYTKGLGITSEPSKVKGEPTERFNRDKFLLDKLDKGESLINLVSGNKLFNTFMDNITISDNEITINVDEYIKTVMSQHGYYDDEKNEWQFEIKEVSPKRKETKKKNTPAALQQKLDDMLNVENEEYSSPSNKKEAMNILRELKRASSDPTRPDFELAAGEADETESQINERWEAGAEEEAGEALESATQRGRGETTEKMLKAKLTDEAIKGAKSLSSIEIDGKLESSNQMDLTGLSFTLNKVDGTKVPYPDYVDLITDIETHIPYEDVKNALLNDTKEGEENPLKMLILDTITPQDGKLTLGIASIGYMKKGWLGGKRSKDFVQAVRGMMVSGSSRKKTSSEDEDPVQRDAAWDIQIKAVLFLLGVYHDFNKRGFDMGPLLHAYDDDKELIGDLKEYRSSIQVGDNRDLGHLKMNWSTLHEMEESELVPFLDHLEQAIETGYSIGRSKIKLNYNPKGNLSFQFNIEDLYDKHDDLHSTFENMNIDAYNTNAKESFSSIEVTDELKEKIFGDIVQDRSSREIEPAIKTLSILESRNVKMEPAEGQKTMIMVDSKHKRGRTTGKISDSNPSRAKVKRENMAARASEKQTSKIMTDLKRIQYNYQQLRGRT